MICFRQPDGFTTTGKDLLPPYQDPNLAGYGTAVALNSADGTRLAIGRPTGNGAIFLYQFDGTIWNLLQTFRGSAGEGIGKYFALSADGTRIAIRGVAANKTAVRLYQVDTGNMIGGILTCDSPGRQVSMSGDGRVVAMSCEGFDSKRGLVQFFYLDDNNRWIARGVLQGFAYGDLFGFDTSLSTLGNRVAVSAPGFEGVGMNDIGSVGIYDYTSSTNAWTIAGSELHGLNTRDKFGYSVALSGDGRVFVASSPGMGTNSFSSSIKTFVNFRGIWIQVGGELTTTLESFDGPLSINDNGSRIAVSSSSLAPNLNSIYRVRVFDLVQGIWKQHGDTMTWVSNPSDPDTTGLSIGGFGGNRLAFATCVLARSNTVRVLDYAPVLATPLQGSPTRAPTSSSSMRLGGEDWNIDVVDIFAAFNEQESQEIRAIYEFKHDREFTYGVMELDCQTPVDDHCIQSSTVLGANVSEGKDRLNLLLDLNQTAIASCPCYTQLNSAKAILTLCLRVDLLNDEMAPLVSEKNRLYIEIDVLKNFQVTDLDAESGAISDFQMSVSLDYNINACQCDESLECVSRPLSDQDDARICVQTTNTSEVEIDAIRELKFVQAGLTQTAVEDGEALKPFAAVEQIGNFFVIQMRLVPSFFDSSDPGEITAVGACRLKFKTSPTRTRSLSSSSIAPNASAAFDVGFEIRRTEKTTSCASVSAFACPVAFMVAALGFVLSYSI